LLSSLFVLPAMYVVNDKIATRKNTEKTAKTPGLDLPILEKTGNAMKKRSVSIAVLAVFTLLTGFFVYTSMHAEFEADMLKIEPADMPSVLTHHEILQNFEINPDFAMVTTDTFNKSRKISDRLKNNRLVGMVDSITQYLPSTDEQKKRKPLIEKIRQNAERYLDMNIQGGMPTGAIADIPEYLTKSSVSNDELNLFIDELDRLQMNVEEIGQIAFMGMQNRLRRYCDKLTGGKDKSKSEILALKKEFKNNSEIRESIAEWQQNYIPFLAQNLVDMSDTETITVKTLPKNIIDQYMNKNGDNLVTIYAAVDLWNGNKMKLFQKATSAVSKNVTGTVILMDRLITLIGSKGLEATLFSLLAVFIILLIDFKNLWQALFATVPLIVGFIWMIGIFVFLGFKFDVANVTAIPLILGIGIDDAVHIMHGIKREGVNRLGLIYKQTGRALILTSITTGVAFGSIAFAHHRGLAGMGILLFIGVISCLLASLFVLPAIISLFFNKRVNKAEE
ncbi:MAG: MMPL family transporter, partial [Deltaproteobacteria bacterium]|nr:MMPL family transporter [Deltaproteobacteria bacterium]